MHTIIAADEEYHTGQYYKARRHTIQLDFDDYVRDLKKEIERGRKRAEKQGKAMPVPAAA